MKCLVNNEIIKLYKTTGKNVNYMLDYLLSTIDPKNSKKYFALFEELSIDGLDVEVEISENNVNYIKVLFGDLEDKLIEKLLWVALLLQEI